MARPWERKFLGFSFTGTQGAETAHRAEGDGRFKERVRELTRRTRGVSLEQMVARIRAATSGDGRLFRAMRDS